MHGLESTSLLQVEFQQLLCSRISCGMVVFPRADVRRVFGDAAAQYVCRRPGGTDGSEYFPLLREGFNGKKRGHVKDRGTRLSEWATFLETLNERKVRES